MENSSSIGKNAFQYRIVTSEILGVVLTFAITVIVALILYFIKYRQELAIDILLFITIFLIQFILIFFISKMQYKNLKYIIGQNAVSFQRGAFTLERKTIPFEKIKNSTFDQTIMQRIFSVGDITIEQEGDQEYIWENIDSKTATLISNAVSAKGDVQPITVAALNTLTNTAAPSEPIK